MKLKLQKGKFSDKSITLLPKAHSGDAYKISGTGKKKNQVRLAQLIEEEEHSNTLVLPGKP